MRTLTSSIVVMSLSVGLWGCPPKQLPDPAVTDPVDPVAEPVVEEKPLTIAEVHAQVNEAAAWLTTGDVGQAQQALRQLDALARKAPELAEIPYNRGVAYQIIGDENMARKEYLRATDIDPSLSAAWLNLGAIAQQSGDLDKALSMYRAGQRSSPDDPDLISGVIGVLRELGKDDEAIAQSKAALAQNANNINVYNHLGLIYIEQGNLELAQFVYQKALNDVPGAKQNAMIHANLGQVLLLKEKIANARVELEKALELDPQLVVAMMFLAQLHMDNRDWESTVAVLEQARALQPNNPGIHLNLGIGYRGLGRFEEAQRSYQKALELDPGNPDPYLNLAVLLGDHMKSYDAALDALDTYTKQGGTREELVAEWTQDIEKQKKRFERAEARRQRREEAKRREELARQAEEEAAQQPPPEPEPEPPAPEERSPQHEAPQEQPVEEPKEDDPWGG
ncbi:MAG: tetratricopeptide repeat protein [Myxococcota bacterium]